MVDDENVDGGDDKKKVLSGRIFHIMQYLHDKDGNELISEAVIKIAIETHKNVLNWAYILHDKDVKLDGDSKPIMDADNKAIPVAPHYHIIIQLKGSAPLPSVAKWFGVEEQYVERNKIRGQYAFAANCAYLVHRKQKYKYQYEETEVKANFDYPAMLHDYEISLIKKDSKPKNITDFVRQEVMLRGMTLREAREKYPNNFVDDFAYLEKCRKQYLSNLPFPDERMNFYICGGGGYGKDVCSVALARSLFPDIDNDEEIYFRVGGENVTFEGYDGQPVVIWSDFRSRELYKRLGGKNGIYTFFDTHPRSQNRQNVKYGSVRLLNKYNIINSVQSYQKFLLGIAGEYGEYKAEDTTQSFRRFPFIIPVGKEHIDFLINQGFAKENGNYNEYEHYMRIEGSLKKLHQIYGNDVPTVKVTEKQLMKPIVDKANEVVEHSRIKEKGLPENFGKVTIYSGRIENVNDEPIDINDVIDLFDGEGGD